MNCTHCGKRLSRKSARLIDGVVMCSKCMFTPAKQRKTIAVTAARSDEMLLQLGPQGKGANSSEYYMNTLETTMTPNETSPDQAVEAVALCPHGQPGTVNCPAVSAIPTPPPADHTDLIAQAGKRLADRGRFPSGGDVPYDVALSSIADALQAHASPRELRLEAAGSALAAQVRSYVAGTSGTPHLGHALNAWDAARTALELG